MRIYVIYGRMLSFSIEKPDRVHSEELFLLFQKQNFFFSTQLCSLFVSTDDDDDDQCVFYT